jgi:hypothetical protein
MKEIKLTRGYVAKVDDVDFEGLNKFKWQVHIDRRRKSRYAMRSEKGPEPRRHIRMHNVILRPPAGFYADHIDRDGLNNQRSNLRLATHRENCLNTRATTHKSTDRGVYWNHSGWRAVIRCRGVQIHLGQFKDKTNALIAYDMAALMFDGDFAITNILKPVT